MSAPPIPALRGENIVCFSKDWSLDPTSNHHVMTELARHNRVLWIDSIAMRSPSLKSKRDLGKIWKKLRSLGAPRNVQDDLWVYTPLVLPFPGSAIATRLNDAILRATLRILRRRLGMEKFQLWTFLPNVAPYADRLGAEMLVYYCVDEWSKFSYVEGGRMAELEKAICCAADVVFATSRSLWEKLRRYNPETHLAAHGVDHALFASALDPATPVPEDVARLPAPVIGFYGLVQDWVDLGLLERLALAHPDWSFAIVGSVVVDVSRLARLPNVHFLGHKPHADLPGYCKAFSVGLVPHHVNELTVHMSPIKLREYLSAGLPVVTTALPEALPYRDHLTVASDHDAFERGIEAALQEKSPAERRARSDAMRDETWERRVHSLGGHVARVAERKRAAGEGPISDRVPFLVTGASGKIGRAVVDALRARG